MAENLAMQTTEERTDTLIKLVYDESSTCSKVILFFSYSWVYTLFFVDYSSLATNRYLPPLQFYQYYAFALTVGLYTFCVYSHSRWAVFFTVFFGLISFATLFFYIFATYTSGYFGDNYVNLYDGITCYPGYTNDSSNCDWGTQWNASYIGEGTYSSSLMVGTITVVSI